MSGIQNAQMSLHFKYARKVDLGSVLIKANLRWKADLKVDKMLLLSQLLNKGDEELYLDYKNKCYYRERG
jgi:hypothetical protein